jgi:5S rRNA maturation endonuclease (ribonuclease M5)
VKQSATLRKSLQQAVSKYHAALPESVGGRYLEEDRGLPLDKVERFRLGFVSEPEIGHEMFRGRLAIPYLRKSVAGVWNVVGMKFRVVPGVPCAMEDRKYLYLPGEKPRLYNTYDAITNDDEVSIAEGELDAVTASAYGIPCVGAPGATSWQDHFTEIFYGYETVFILCDGDDAGLKFGTGLAKKLPNARVIPMDIGEDVNSTVHKYGVDKILERMGRGRQAAT